jgi:hypothetical protein
MKAEAIRFIGKVLPDGHLSLPVEASRQIGSVFDVVLLPVNNQDIYEFAESLANDKGIAALSLDDIESIVHESRGIS